MVLEKEWKTFQRELPRLLQDPTNRGKHALIHGDEVISLWNTVEEGINAGYDRFGLFEPFMVQEVTDEMKPLYCSREVTRCL
jgi:hypothetical protein